MKKSTKNNPEPKYGIADQKGVDKMWQKSKNVPSRVKPEDVADATKAGGEAEANALGETFAVIDPIDTIVGPIGRFTADIDHFPLHPAIAAFGKRRTGKSFTLRDWFFHAFQHIPFGICMTRTKQSGYWSQYIPDDLVFQDLRANALQTLIAVQNKKIKKWKKEHKAETEEDPDAYKRAPELAAFCILDDVISDRTAMLYNTELTSLFVEGRHMCITVVIATQYPKGIGPMVRGNCDIALFQPIFSRTDREILSDIYGGWMDRRVFNQLMDDIVVDENLPGSTPQQPNKRVRTMVVNDFENTTNPQIKFRYYEAIDPGPFKLLDPEYWKQQDNPFKAGESDDYDPVNDLDECLNGYSSLSILS